MADNLSTNPTSQAYRELQQLYDFFNQALFAGELPTCLITMQRKKRVCGYFHFQRFTTSDDSVKTDEIAINPHYFATVPLKEIAQTMVHEMVHQWQFHFGNPSRRSYHNMEWSRKMEAVGLMPSSTGEPGGTRTGQSMADYSIEGGCFERAFEELDGTGFSITWEDALPKRQQKTDTETGEMVVVVEELKPTRQKYSCPSCGVNVWGKPGLNIVCGDCGEGFLDVGH